MLVPAVVVVTVAHRSSVHASKHAMLSNCRMHPRGAKEATIQCQWLSSLDMMTVQQRC